MVGVAQLVERRSVAPNVAGSIPVSHPNLQAHFVLDVVSPAKDRSVAPLAVVCDELQSRSFLEALWRLEFNRFHTPRARWQPLSPSQRVSKTLPQFRWKERSF